MMQQRILLTVEQKKKQRKRQIGLGHNFEVNVVVGKPAYFSSRLWTFPSIKD